MVKWGLDARKKYMKQGRIVVTDRTKHVMNALMVMNVASKANSMLRCSKGKSVLLSGANIERSGHTVQLILPL